MPCTLAAVIFGIPKVQSCHQASKRTRPEKAGIEPSLENGENPPAISSRMPAVNSRRADNCSILGKCHKVNDIISQASADILNC